jgi:hypothetical protein
MKWRAFTIGLSLGMMILSVAVLIVEPPFGRENAGIIGGLARNAAPILIPVSCLAIALFAVKLRILSLIGLALMIGSLITSYILSESTGYSMGTTGWTSALISMFVIIPLGLLLCFFTGLFSLAHIMIRDQDSKKEAGFAVGIVIILGIAYFAVIAIKPDVRALVLSLQNEELASQRFSTASRLIEIRDNEKVVLLIDLLKDGNPRVREAAAVALGGIPTKAHAVALKPLLEALENETDPDAKEWMVRRLATIVPMCEDEDRKQGVDVLIGILKTDDSTLKGIAAESLGWIKDKRAIGPLIEALDDEAFYARNALITITGERDHEAWQRHVVADNP